MSEHDAAGVDAIIRVAIYETLVERGVAPTRAELAHATGLAANAVATSMARLAAAHVLVLDDAGDVRMAMPFSAVPTAFRVRSGDRAWWANCAWDALGIAAATECDIAITTECPDCGAPLTLGVRNGALQSSEGVAHFAVPAAHWWDDIGYT
ncbi:MAG TPA: organomercurial lyase [Gemmatimonadaceae bacterium]|nr:organomercurial lyase [Gemmatimonadaceae bacterium]